MEETQRRSSACSGPPYLEDEGGDARGDGALYVQHLLRHHRQHREIGPAARVITCQVQG